MERKLKTIRSCPINPTRCEFKKQHGCVKFSDVNECPHCRHFRKRQAKTSRYNEENRKYVDLMYIVK